jgi:hypothetical protein
MVGLADTELETIELELKLEDVTILLLLVDEYWETTSEEEEEEEDIDELDDLV